MPFSPRLYYISDLPSANFVLALFIALVLALSQWGTASVSVEDHPLSEIERTELREQFMREQIMFERMIQQKPTQVSLYSRRGDARLFLKNFPAAVADYEKMIALNPKLDPSHWRLGIAYYYTGQYEKAARQFEIYHTHDNVDRENGIWRFMSQAKVAGMIKARKNLLRYEKTDRPPYPWLYALYAGKIQPETVFEKIRDAEFKDGVKTRVLFHANLYVGIFHELHGDESKALSRLRLATANKYGRDSGTYMWQVARIHYERLKERVHKLPQKVERN